MSKTVRAILKKSYDFLILIISMTGFVPKHATVLRSITMVVSFAFAYYLSTYQPLNSRLAIIYFLAFEVFYVGFITIALSKNGLRLWFIKT